MVRRLPAGSSRLTLSITPWGSKNKRFGSGEAALFSFQGAQGIKQA
ncbi:MAG: hypothetical protein ABIK28_04470 [Planctomycetota bacterium]